MFFNTPKRPLVSCDIIHSLPGRLRIHCRALGLLDEHKKAEDHLPNQRKRDKLNRLNQELEIAQDAAQALRASTPEIRGIAG